MLKILIEKELKAIFLSPKFIATFGVSSILILLSIVVGIREYKAAVKQYESATQLAAQELREQSSYQGLRTRVYRKPHPMQIFVSGVQHDVGRLSAISSFSAIKLTNSVYSDDPIFAVFRFIDFTFIVKIVLSLIAVLFTYDAVNGEREKGTLKLIFSNAVPRAQYILAKLIGSWIGMVIPLLIPILLGLLLVSLFGIPLTGEHWIKITLLIGSAILFFTYFIASGLLISSFTRHSAIAFLILLVSWVFFVLIFPRAGVMAAGKLVPLPSAAEIDGQQDGFAKSRWTHFTEEMQTRWQKRSAAMAGLSKEERANYRDEHLWEWMEEEDAARKQVEAAINDFNLKLQEDLRNRKAQQERLAFTISRFSPASAFQLTAMNLADTNIRLKTRYEDAMQNYRTQFIEYKEKKQKETGSRGGIRITLDSESGMKIDTGRDKGHLNLSDMPKFTPPQTALNDAVAPTIIDFGLLALFTLTAFAGAFVAFLKYDVR
ncbi:MAG: ABC transporter permease subunit [bacterium]